MSTLAVTFPFSSNSQSFAFTGGSGNQHGNYESSGGNPGGCLEIQASTGSNFGYWSLTVSYSTLGIPSGATITAISALTCDISATIPAGNVVFGSNTDPIAGANFQTLAVFDTTSAADIWLTNTGGVTYSANQPWTTITGSTTATSATSLTVSATPSETVTIYVGAGLNPSSQLNQFFFDNVGFTITYSAPAIIPGSITETATAVDTIGSAVKSAAPFALRGGRYSITAYATGWNGSSVRVQRLSGDGMTYLDTISSITANHYQTVDLPSGTYRILSTVATAGSVDISPVSRP